MSRRWLRLFLVVGLLLIALALPGWWIYGQIRAWSEFRSAQTALKNDAPQTAREHLAFCMKVWPTSGEVRFLAARANRQCGDLFEANQLLDEAAERGWVEEAIDLERSLVRAQAGKFKEIEPYLRSCVEGDHPDSSVILAVITPLYLKSYDLGRAEYFADKWIELQPNSSMAWSYRGQVAEKRRTTARALESYREAVRLNPSARMDRQALAQLLLDTNQVAEARPLLEELTQEKPDDLASWLLLARCLNLLDRPGEAREVTSRILDAQPNHAEALALRGRLELADNRVGVARKYLSRAIALQPYDPEILYSWQQCLSRSGATAEAEQVTKKLARVRADLAELRRVTSQVMANPERAEPRRRAGEIHLRNGQEEEGLRWLNSVLAVNPNDPATHRILAGFFKEKGDHQQAARHQRIAESSALNEDM